jgi:hypothetical protein|tara:strand:- start:579 stop:1040 length:462 start_codon:yes stop_codon:yes gene_type:complete
MSYDTHRNFAYIQSGKYLKLYRVRRNASRIIDSQGRVRGDDLEPLVYPDENITEGLRIEYTAIEKPFVNEDPETTANASLNDNNSPDESTHVNLNRTLSLAVVCYVKAQLAERAGNIDLKEYYMREFYKKVADNESNKNKVFMAKPMSAYAVK